MSPRRSFLLAAVLLAAAVGATAGVLAARNSGDGGDSPLGARAEAEEVYGPDGKLLGSEQAGDPAVHFPAALEDLPNPASHLTVDASGHLWFVQFAYGGPTNKLYHYDPAADALESFDIPASVGSELFSAIAVDGRGHVISAEGYLVLDFDPSSDTFKEFTLPESPAGAASLSGHEGTFITDMTLDGEGRVYISRMNVAAIAELDLNTGETRDLPFLPSFGPAYDIALAGNTLWMTSRWDQEGRGPARTGYVGVSSGRFQAVPGKTTALASAPGGPAYAIGWEPLGLVTVGDTGLSPVATVPSLSAGASSRPGLADYLAVDGVTGVVWMTTDGSRTLSRLDPSTGAATTYELPRYVTSIEPLGCSLGEPCPTVGELATHVRALAVAPNGDLYFSDATRNRVGVIGPRSR